ncbi:hypothetical protein MBLNU230_g3232t1 [Neophaeotheca triangularis]
MYAFVAASLVASSYAALIPRDDCCFGLSSSGGVSGMLGQLEDGQNRVVTGGDQLPNPNAQYCINGDGAITDGRGNGCILTPPTTQLQCDEGAAPIPGFSVSPDGTLQYQGDSTFYACPADEGEYNFYTQPVEGQSKCVEVSLSTGGKCSGNGDNGQPKGGEGNNGKPTTTQPAPEGNQGKPSATKPASDNSYGKPSATKPAPTQPAPEDNGKPDNGKPDSGKPDEGKPDEGKPDQGKPDQGKPDQGKPDQGKPDQGKPDEDMPDQGKPDEGKPDEGKPDEGKPDEGKPDEDMPDQGKPDEGKPDEGKPDEGKPDQDKPDQDKPDQDKPDEGKPDEGKPDQGKPDQGKPDEDNGNENNDNPSPTKPAGKTCPTNLSGTYEYPHLIVPVKEDNPDKAYGTSYNGEVSDSTSSIFNFDIPYSYEGKTCTVVFMFPKKEDLETSDYDFSGSGDVDFSMLEKPATEDTTYNTCPKDAEDYGTTHIQPGNSYVVSTGDCQAGQRVGYKMSAGDDTDLTWFNDYNPASVGMFMTVC